MGGPAAAPPGPARRLIGSSKGRIHGIQALALEASWRYEGLCGSPFPFRAAPYGDYVRRNLSYATWMLTSERWWIMPGVLLAGTGVAWLIDRLRSRP